MRTTPLWLFPDFLQQADDLLRKFLVSTLNSSLDERSWIQATLPIKFGGIGIRNLKDVCLPAFLASDFGVLESIKHIFPSNGDVTEIFYLQEALDKWFTI